MRIYQQLLAVDTDDAAACGAADLSGDATASEAACTAAAREGGSCSYA